MSFTELLDPREVLAHLKQLGYRNITQDQLKEFMYDLKKLIKYDQKQKESNKENVEHLDSSSSPCNCIKCCCERRKEKVIDMSHLDRNTSTSSSNLSECSSSSLETTTTTATKSYGVYARPERGGILSKPCERPQSSFIRPWRLHAAQGAGQGGSGAPTKSDPVALYHRYKELWAMQKPPGENSHHQLRWCIRERMLGQDPHPRPMSQASSIERRKGVHPL